jgi:hypothetical protein
VLELRTPADAARLRALRQLKAVADILDGEALLRVLADGDLTAVAPVDVAELDDETMQLAEIVALAAVDAPRVSWFAHVGTHRTTVPLEKVAAALLAVAPILGAPRVVAAAGKLVGATDLVEEVDEEVT